MRSEVKRRNDVTDTRTESDTGISRPDGMGGQCYAIAILQKSSPQTIEFKLFPVRTERIEQCSETVGLLASHRSRAKQVSRPDIAPIRSLMRDHLGWRPEQIGGRCAR